jgi:DNA-binding IclR family transcriptional regulator
VRFFTHVGKRFPAYVTSIGKAIAAYLPEEKLEEVLKLQSFRAHTPNTITSPRAFREHLKLIRSRGYAVDNEENRLTVCCIGAPVFDSEGKVIAGISISGPSFRLTWRKMRELSKPLKSTAVRISRSLGYGGNFFPEEKSNKRKAKLAMKYQGAQGAPGP